MASSKWAMITRSPSPSATADYRSCFPNRALKICWIRSGRCPSRSIIKGIDQYTGQRGTVLCR